MTQLLEFVRSVCFGALAVSSTFLLAHAYFPEYFPANVSRWEVFYAGTVFGTLLHRVLHWLLFNTVSQAAGRSLSFYAKFAELNVLRQTGALTEKEFNNVAAQLKADYFGVPVERLTEGDGPPPPPPDRQDLEAAHLTTLEPTTLSARRREPRPRPHPNEAKPENQVSLEDWPVDDSRAAKRAGWSEAHAAGKADDGEPATEGEV